MKKQELKSELLLLLTAAIWGFAFVAQRIGAGYVGAFTFNGIRFALGAFSLLPLLIYFSHRSNTEKPVYQGSALRAGLITGTVLFVGAWLQQAGMATTEAGKTAFITGLYMVLVPLAGVVLKQKIHVNAWAGVILAVIGLYLLSVTGKFSMVRGDILVLAGTPLWATHILLIDYYTKRVDSLKLAFVQFLTCSILSLLAASQFEVITRSGLLQAAIPILYGGLLSVGVAYTLQVIAQQHVNPTHAAIICSLETVFGALGGLVVLGEIMTARGYIGCALMLAGMLVAQNKGSSERITEKAT